MDAEQLKFLKDKYRKASLDQPDLKILKMLLLRLGGSFIVAPSSLDADIPALLEAGFVMNGAVKVKRMKASSCHQNIASIWRAHRAGILGIATGYALSKDDLWRQHSWGVLREGLLETTEMRQKYFGILLQGEKADHFSRCNP